MLVFLLEEIDFRKKSIFHVRAMKPQTQLPLVNCRNSEIFRASEKFVVNWKLEECGFCILILKAVSYNEEHRFLGFILPNDEKSRPQIKIIQKPSLTKTKF